MTTSRRAGRIGVALCVTAMLAFGIMAALAATGSVTYTYDALGRLSTANYDTGVCIAYAYDANGNRTSQTVTVSGAGATGYWGCFTWGNAQWGTH
jgi:hypothetical protein